MVTSGGGGSSSSSNSSSKAHMINFTQKFVLTHVNPFTRLAELTVIQTHQGCSAWCGSKDGSLQ
jgi:hypothetical protein